MKNKLMKIRPFLARMRYTVPLLFLSLCSSALSLPVHANSITDSKIGTGLKKLIQDSTSFLMIVAPIAMIVMIIYFCIRKGMADEMDQKKWNGRILTAIISCVGAFVASVIIGLATTYFG